MLLCLSLVVDVDGNTVKVTDARFRGLGVGERELAKAGGEKGEGGWALTTEGEAVAAKEAATSPSNAAKPVAGNLMAGVPKPAAASQAAGQGSLAGDLMLLGLDEETTANLLKLHSVERLRKLLTWVRVVQGREGVSRPDLLFVKCLAKGVQ